MKRKRVSRVRRRVRRRRDGRFAKGRRVRTAPRNSVKFSRKQWVTYFVPTSASTSGFWQYFSFSLSNVTSFPEVTDLFDQYKIARLKYEFRPRFTTWEGNVTAVNANPTFVSIINDPRSSFTPVGSYGSAAYNTFAAQGRVKTYSSGRPFTVYFRPTVNDNMAGGATKKVAAPFLQTSNTTEPHYGFHAFFHTPNFVPFSGTAQNWDIYVTAYIIAKGMK